MSYFLYGLTFAYVVCKEKNGVREMKKQVLIAGTNRIVSLTLGQLLIGRGWEVVEASNPDQLSHVITMAIRQDIRFDLVIMNLEDGFLENHMLLEFLTANDSPVMGIGGSGFNAEAVSDFPVSIDPILLRPFPTTEFLHHVESLQEQRKAMMAGNNG